MLLTREYPATHSMSTAWYFVDEDDNVAIFDIQDNGPVPVAASDTDNDLTELCFFQAISEDGPVKKLNFTDDQVELFFKGMWSTAVMDLTFWYDAVLQIDGRHEREFLDYLAEHRGTNREEYDNGLVPICLSRKQGIYLVDLDGYDYGDGLHNPYAKFLLESGIVLRFCNLPYLEHFREQVNGFKASYPEASCPYYIYCNEYDARLTHRRVTEPVLPVRLWQMPAHIRSRITRLNLRFSESESIQIASEVLCHQTSYGGSTGRLLTPEGYEYLEVEMPSRETAFVLNAGGPGKGDGLSAGLPLVLSASQAGMLKRLPINVSFRSLLND